MVSNLVGAGKGTDGESDSGVDHRTAANPSLVFDLYRIDFTIILPRKEILAPSPNCKEMVQSHPPRLVAWQADSDQKKFQMKLLISSLAHGEARPSPIWFSLESLGPLLQSTQLVSLFDNSTPCARFSSREVPCGSGIQVIEQLSFGTYPQQCCQSMDSSRTTFTRLSREVFNSRLSIQRPEKYQESLRTLNLWSPMRLYHWSNWQES